MTRKRLTITACILVLLIASAMVLPACSAAIMTDEEAYLAAVAEIMERYQKDPEGVEEELLSMNTILLTEPEIVFYNDGEVVSRETLPTDYSLSVYSFKRGNQSANYYLQWLLEVNATEWFPGPLDYVCFEWNEDIGAFYSASGDGVYSTPNNRMRGVVPFNVQDTDMSSGDYTYGTVVVTPAAGGWLEFGARYEHTYTGFLISGSAGYEYKPSSEIDLEGIPTLGLEEMYSIKVNIGASTEKWYYWAGNAVYFG